MAACLCGGQWWKAGRRVQSCGMYLWSMRSIIPNVFLVQVHIIGPSPHSIIQCWRESLCPHFEHALVAVSWMATNRSLVGIIPCIAAYHVDFMVSETTKACKFFHTLSHTYRGIFDRFVCHWVCVIEPTVPGSERAQTHALDRTATGICPALGNSPQ
jgi:hypothetical protein